MTTRVICSSLKIVKTIEYNDYFYVQYMEGSVHGPYKSDDKRFSPAISSPK